MIRPYQCKIYYYKCYLSPGSWDLRGAEIKNKKIRFFSEYNLVIYHMMSRHEVKYVMQ